MKTDYGLGKSSGRETAGTFRKRQGYGSEYKPQRQEFPSMMDELGRNLQKLKSSLDEKNEHIRDLKKAKENMASRMYIKDIHIEDLRRRIQRYQEFFYKDRPRETPKKQWTEIQ